MEFGAEIDGTEDFFQMFWPTVLAHKAATTTSWPAGGQQSMMLNKARSEGCLVTAFQIDRDSPLWTMTARDISNKQFEIVLTMEGTTPETDNTVQV